MKRSREEAGLFVSSQDSKIFKFDEDMDVRKKGKGKEEDMQFDAEYSRLIHAVGLQNILQFHSN